MSRPAKQDPTTGLMIQSLDKVILGGLFVFIALIATLSLSPYYLSLYFYIAVPFGMLGLVNLIWINVHPNLYARFFLNTCISILCLLIAFRALDNLLPGFSQYNALLLIIVAVFAHTLPMWNPAAARFIRDELSAPKTRMGKIVFRISLALIPIVGFLAAMFESILARENKSAGLSFILAILGLLVTIVLPFAYRFPSSPWEGQEK